MDASGLSRTAGSRVAARISEMLVAAGVVASTGKGSTGALGNGSTACAVEPPDGFNGAATVGGFDSFLRGGSHFAQTIPDAMGAPHRTHLVAMTRSRRWYHRGGRRGWAGGTGTRRLPSRRGDAETRRRGDVETRRRGDRDA